MKAGTRDSLLLLRPPAIPPVAEKLTIDSYHITITSNGKLTACARTYYPERIYSPIAHLWDLIRESFLVSSTLTRERLMLRTGYSETELRKIEPSV